MPLNGNAKPLPKGAQTAKSPSGVSLPKKPSPKRAGERRWKELRDRRLGPCYVCEELGLVQQLESTLHHVVSKSLGGHDTEGNLVPLCGDGTRGHHGLIEAHDPVACQSLARYIQAHDDLVYSYAIDHLGEDGFLRRYKVRFSRA